MWLRWVITRGVQWMETEDRKFNRSINIKLVNWYRLEKANQWPIDNYTQTVHRLLSIGYATFNTHHARYLSDLTFLWSPGDEIGNTNSNPVFSIQRIYPVAHVLELSTCQSLPLNIRYIIILQQFMLLLLTISLFAKLQLLFNEFFCEGTMRPLFIFWSL